MLTEDIWSGKPHRLRLDQPGRSLSVFDTRIKTGPYRFTVEARLQEPDKLRLNWESASEGELLEFTWEWIGPATISPLVLRRKDLAAIPFQMREDSKLLRLSEPL